MQINERLSAGSTVTRISAPSWVKFAQFLSALNLSLGLGLAMIAFNKWHWATKHSMAEGILLFTGSSVFALMLLYVFLKNGYFYYFYNSQHSFSGRRILYKPKWSALEVLVAFLGITIPFLILLGSAYYIHRTSPFPAVILNQTSNQTKIGERQKPLSLFFWEYGLTFEEDQLLDYEIVLPYERGPPEQFIGKIFFVETKNHNTILALHGKRPRTYPDNSIENLFQNYTSQSTLPSRFEIYNIIPQAPLLIAIQKEAGLLAYNSNPFLNIRPVLSRTVFTRNSDLLPLEIIGSPLIQSQDTKFFYRGPGGSVFQVQCNQCPFANVLSEAVFVDNGPATIRVRRVWTSEKIKSILTALFDAPEADKKRLTHIITFYLASILSIDPRDPEAFFHLGKLTPNKDTLRSALRYGQDVGLSKEKLAELQDRLEHMP